MLLLSSPSESGKYIAERAQHVEIVDAGVQRCAEELERRVRSKELTLQHLFTKTEVHPQKADEAGLDWVFVADTLNFSFWVDGEDDDDDEVQVEEDALETLRRQHYSVTYKGRTYTGYLALCAAINRTLDSGVRLTSPGFYGSVTVEDLDGYLMGDEATPCPMVAERAACLREVAQVLDAKYEGRFQRCVERCQGSAAALLELVRTDFPCFRDVAEYRGQAQVSLLKRAQILVADVWALFEGQGLGRFHDVDSAITMFADYRVPQSLLYFGALKYSPQLDEELRKPRSRLLNGCQFEVEIRGCSIEAVARIVRATNERLQQQDQQQDDQLSVNCILADYFLWAFRREKADEIKRMAIPFHKVRSIYY